MLIKNKSLVPTIRRKHWPLFLTLFVGAVAFNHALWFPESWTVLHNKPDSGSVDDAGSSPARTPSFSLSDHLVTFFYRLFDFGKERVYHYTLLGNAGNPVLPFNITMAGGGFFGTHALHMSSHTCVGTYEGHGKGSTCNHTNLFCIDPFSDPYPDRTCSFTNLYYARLSEHPPPYSSHNWYYFYPVPPATAVSPLFDPELTRAALKSAFKVDLLSRLKQDSLWRIEVVFFLAEATWTTTPPLTRPPPELRKGGFMDPLSLPSTVVHSSSQCTLTPKSSDGDSILPSLSSIACLPPGVGGYSRRSFFFMLLSHHHNIGHTIFDDLIPFLAAMATLGLPLPPFDILVTCVPQEQMRRWPSLEPYKDWFKEDQGVRTAFYFASPNQDVVEIGTLGDEAGDTLVLFPMIAGGLTGMSPHNYRPNTLVFGAEPPMRSVWTFRQYMLAQMGVSEWERSRGVKDIPQHTRYTEAEDGRGVARHYSTFVVFVVGKREISNLEPLLEELALAYPTVMFSKVAWEKTGGIANEAALLLKTHILVSLDGTAALKTLFLPPGAVFIELGVSAPWGSQMLCDYLHGAYDHIRVLHYEFLEPWEHEHDILSSMVIPPHKLSVYLDQALQLIKAGFPIPVDIGTNLDGNANLLRHLFKRFPELAFYGVDMWTQRHLKTERVFEGAEKWYEIFVGKPAPRELREEIFAFCAAHPCGNSTITPPPLPPSPPSEVEEVPHSAL